MKARGMDSRIPSNERAVRMILVLIEGVDFSAEQKAQIRARLDQPNRVTVEKFNPHAKGVRGGRG